MPNATFFFFSSCNRRWKMKRKRWERNWKLLISNFSLIICFGLWGIRIITLSDGIKKGINSLIDNFLNNFFLFRRKALYSVNLSMKSIIASIFKIKCSLNHTGEKKTSFIRTFCPGLVTTDTKQQGRMSCLITQDDVIKTFGLPFLHTPNPILPTCFFSERLQKLYRPISHVRTTKVPFSFQVTHSGCTTRPLSEMLFSAVVTTNTYDACS